MSKKHIILVGIVILAVLAAILVLMLKAKVAADTPINTEDRVLNTNDVNDEAGNFEKVEAPRANALEVTGPSLGVMPNSPSAPKQEVVPADLVPDKAIKIAISDDGFTPNQFKVKAGEEVILALSSVDGKTHVFMFPRAALMSLTTMVLSGETKTITFNAPVAGTYSFRDDLPDNRDNGGVMIVE